MTDPGSAGGHEAAAQRLVEAAERRTPCDPIRDLLPGGTIDDAYAVAQRAAAEVLGAGTYDALAGGLDFDALNELMRS